MNQTGLDMSEFQSALREYIPRSQHTIANILNRKMFYIARGAIRLTPNASKTEIEKELFVTGYRLNIGKRGRMLKKQGRAKDAILGGTLIYKILNARRTRAGKPGLNRSEMREAAEKLIVSRFKSIGTLKSGWWGAIRAFALVAGESARRELNLPKIKGAAGAKLARDEWNPIAEMSYNVVAKNTKGDKRIDESVVAALQQAFNDEAKSMRDFIASEMQKDADRINAR